MKQEIWKDVIGYEGLYQVSNLGRLKSKYRILKQSGKRYWKVCLSKNNIHYRLDVHRLVAKAFIPNPHNYIEINHIDGNKHNNNVNNLEWTTRSENLKHAFRIGLKKASSCKKIAKMKNGKELERYKSIIQASRINNIKYSTLLILVKTNKKYNGFSWKTL